MKRLLLAASAALAAAFAATVFVAPATADRPIVSHFTFSQTATLTGACAFPITVDSTSDGTETDFVDESGSLTRLTFDGFEQDVFTANGKTLVGERYHLHVTFIFDENGNVTHIYGQGVVEQVRLPDGSLFISAGRLDFLAHPESLAFLLTPDVGATVNLDGFCAALSAYGSGQS